MTRHTAQLGQTMSDLLTVIAVVYGAATVIVLAFGLMGYAMFRDSPFPDMYLDSLNRIRYALVWPVLTIRWIARLIEDLKENK